MSSHRLKRSGQLALIAAMLIFITTTAGEEAYSANSTSDEVCRCFRGRPATECRMYWITEVGFLTMVDTKNSRRYWDDAKRLTFDIGYMFNVSEKDAIGASLFWHTLRETDFSYWGLKPRYRRWLSNDIGLDVCLGLGQWEYEINRKATPMIAQLGVSFRDYLSLTLMYDRVRWTESVPIPNSHEYYDGDSHTSSTLSVGLTAGSYTGLVAAGVTIFIAILSLETLAAD